MRMTKNTTEQIALPGLERAATWDYPKDNIPVSNYIRLLQDMELEIRYCRGRYPELYRQLKAAKHNEISKYEALIDRIWNDQKTGTYFKKGERFEPHQVVREHNLVMWDGLSRFTELIALETERTFPFQAIGTGTTKPTFDDISLEAEVARVDMHIAGDINADGIILKNSALYPPGVQTAVISEFAAFDSNAGGIMEYRVVIEAVADRLSHTQSLTQVQSSHSIAFIAVENIL